MIRCPSCFQLLPDDRYRWVCVSGRCEKQPDPLASVFLGAETSSGPQMELWKPPAEKRWRRPEHAACRQCSGPVSGACPFCNFELPSDWYESESLCVAMAGARNVGKSVSIGVMIHFLEPVIEALGSSLSWGNDQSRLVYRQHYEKALFDQMGIIGPTSSADTEGAYQREPLIVSLGQIRGRHRYLCVRDVAGEDLERGGQGRPSLGFFQHADLVVFLFDPLTVPAVAQTLQGVIPQQTIVQSANPLDVLNTVLGLVGQGDARLAVVLSKFDAVQELRGIANHGICMAMDNPGAGIMRSTGGPAAYDEQDGALVHEEVRGLLQLLGAGAVVTSVENPRRGRPFPHRFMVTSSLGASVAGTRQSVRGIAPFRVLDPVIWLLHARGVIGGT